MVAFTDNLGISKDATYQIGIYAGVIVLAAILFFSIRRILVVKGKEISSFSDHFVLWFLLVVVVMGIYARLFDEVSSESIREFALSVVRFNPILPPENVWFLVHTLLAEIFIIYTVAAKPMHLVGQFFSQYILVSEKR